MTDWVRLKYDWRLRLSRINTTDSDLEQLSWLAAVASCRRLRGLAKRFSASGWLRPLTRGSAPGTPLVAPPQTPVIGSRYTLAVCVHPTFFWPGDAPGCDGRLLHDVLHWLDVTDRVQLSSPCWCIDVFMEWLRCTWWTAAHQPCRVASRPGFFGTVPNSDAVSRVPNGFVRDRLMSRIFTEQKSNVIMWTMILISGFSALIFAFEFT